MCALDTWSVDELYEVVRRAYNFAGLPRAQFDGVLDMLAGRYPSDEFAELKPRLVWDRVANTVVARRDARVVAVTSGGTIPDRGLYGVFLGEEGPRVGELDEEMVYESRPGETFVLGATTWRIERITPQKVLVSPAPGEPGKTPFWHGDAVGRPIELGRALGAFSREIVALDEAKAVDRLRTDACARRARRAQPARLPGRAARRDRHRAQRPRGRGRALPRRARRLARVHPDPLRRARPRALGAGHHRPPARALRLRPLPDLERRRHRHSPPGRL